MESNKISVVIPTCDRPAAFLHEAIQSALSQSLKPLEVIVVDNGLCAVDKDKIPSSVILVRTEPRVGASLARNTGAKMAKGEFLAFLDDDDWWDPDFLKEAFEVLATTNADCVYGRKDRWVEGKQKKYKEVKNEDLKVSVLMCSNPGVGGINLVVRAKSFHDIGGFDVNLKAAEDRSLAIDLIFNGSKVFSATNAVCVLRDHDGERLRNNSFNKMGFYLKYKKHMPFLYFWSGILKMYRKRVKRWLLGLKGDS